MADKFYTKPATANILLRSVDLYRFDLIVEPSAGAGAISLPLQQCLQQAQSETRLLAIDIAPEHESIIQADFLRDTLQPVLSAQRCLMIGNPPFGRGKTPLAVRFFNRAADFASVQCIAFIVPKSFRKDSVQDRLNLNFHLVKEVEIPRNSFTFRGQDYPVHCIIQVWERGATPRQRAVVHHPNGRYRFLNANGLPAADVIVIKRVGTRAGYCWLAPWLTLDCGYSPGAHFFVHSSEMPAAMLFGALKQVRWSKDNTLGQPSLTKNEVVRELNRLTGGGA